MLFVTLDFALSDTFFPCESMIHAFISAALSGSFSFSILISAFITASSFVICGVVTKIPYFSM